MAYTSPSTWSTGQVVTATQLNEQIRDNMTYVHDGFVAFSQNLYDSTTRLLDGTVYQNTTGKLMIINATFQLTISSGNPNSVVAFYCGTSSPPTTNPIAYPALQSASITFAFYASIPITVYVPPNYYYRVASTTTTIGLVYNWVESLIGVT